MGKYIETALPLAEINDAAIREKAGKRGHPANLHMWWGRSPLAVSYTHLDHLWAVLGAWENPQQAGRSLCIYEDTARKRLVIATLWFP